MWRYRLRIVLLSLGVLVGYGSGFAHLAHRHGRFDHRYHDCPHWSWFDTEPHQAPAKKVQ